MGDELLQWAHAEVELSGLREDILTIFDMAPDIVITRPDELCRFVLFVRHVRQAIRTAKRIWFGPVHSFDSSSVDEGGVESKEAAPSLSAEVGGFAL